MKRAACVCVSERARGRGQGEQKKNEETVAEFVWPRIVPTAQKGDQPFGCMRKVCPLKEALFCDTSRRNAVPYNKSGNKQKPVRHALICAYSDATDAAAAANTHNFFVAS
jgi:hypothetical protein